MPRPVETLSYTFEEISNDHFTLVMQWENTRLVIPFELTTSAHMNDLIAKTLSGPDSGDYTNAAMYALRDGKNYAQALEWFDRALALEQKDSYWNHPFRAQALERLGRKDEAIAGAKRALEFTRISNSDYGISESEAILARLQQTNN